MATTVYLVRHGAHSLLDRVLVGRAAVELNATGQLQAQALARWFAAKPIASVQSSPQLRARQTAAPTAQMRGVHLEIVEAADEIDMGAWTGRRFDDLKEDVQWQLWNSQRDGARPPGGESMREVQSRMVDHLLGLQTQYPDAGVVIVSHGDPIRAALLHFRHRSLNDVHQLHVDPASVSTVVLRGSDAEVVSENVRTEACVPA